MKEKESGSENNDSASQTTKYDNIL